MSNIYSPVPPAYDRNLDPDAEPAYNRYAVWALKQAAGAAAEAQYVADIAAKSADNIA